MQKGLRAKNIAGCLKGYVEYNKVGPLEGRRGSEGQKNAGRLEDSEKYRMVGGEENNTEWLDGSGQCRKVGGFRRMQEGSEECRMVAGL